LWSCATTDAGRVAPAWPRASPGTGSVEIDAGFCVWSLNLSVFRDVNLCCFSE